MTGSEGEDNLGWETNVIDDNIKKMKFKLVDFFKEKNKPDSILKRKAKLVEFPLS